MFSYEKIAGFLRSASQCVPVFPMHACTGAPGMIMRHDVDLDILPAYRFAELERSLGIRSTYFFLMSADTYNPGSKANRRMLREMAGEGFEIGLHFDPTLYPAADPTALEAHARDEAAQLADISGGPVNAVSLHNPDEYGRMPLFESFQNAYDPEYFSNGRYSSDSRMIFRTDPFSLIDLARTSVTQINLHPEHYSDGGDGYPAPMISYIGHAIDIVHRTFVANTSYAKETGGDLRGHVRAFLAGDRPG